MDPKFRLNEIATMRGGAAILGRLRWIDDTVYWTGKLSRGDLANRFSISITQASNDISEYNRAAPDNLVVLTDKRYGPSPHFSPLFPKDPRAFIEAAQSGPQGFPLPIERTVDPWRAAPPDVLAALVAAAVAKEPIAASASGAQVVLCPYRILDDGGDLFVRGWDHELGRVGIYRIAELKELRRASSIPWIDASADRGRPVETSP
jgi:hypothetical protein